MENISETKTLKVRREVQKMYDEDQEDRTGGLWKSNPKLCFKRDQERYARAVEIIENRKVVSLEAESLFHLALLFQHGGKSEDYQLAQSLAQESTDVGYEGARWLVGTAEDRYLLSVNKKQKWGTQMTMNETGDVVLMAMLSDEESGITDEIRKANGIMTRIEMQDYIKKQNKK